METFDFDFHNFESEYPDSGSRMQLGNSYTSAVEPTAPDQRVFILTFTQMLFITDQATGLPSATAQPQINMHRLTLFYERHKLWQPFNYYHMQFGLLVVRFNKPLKIPKLIPGQDGITESFTVELQEQP